MKVNLCWGIFSVKFLFLLILITVLFYLFQCAQNNPQTYKRNTLSQTAPPPLKKNRFSLCSMLFFNLLIFISQYYIFTQRYTHSSYKQHTKYLSCWHNFSENKMSIALDFNLQKNVMISGEFLFALHLLMSSLRLKWHNLWDLFLLLLFL